MRAARGKDHTKDLCSGPGKLVEAMGITKDMYGLDLTKKGALVLLDDGFKPDTVATPRIGISKAKERPWRFVLKDSHYLSK